MLFVYDGKRYKVLSCIPPSIKAQRYEDDLEIVEFRLEMLMKENTFRILDRKQNYLKKTSLTTELDLIPEEKRNEVTRKLDLVKPLILYQESSIGNIRSKKEFEEKYYSLLGIEENTKLNISIIIKIISSKFNLSVRTLWNYWNQWNNAGIEGLVTKKGSGIDKRKDNCYLELRDPKNKDLVIDRIPSRLTKNQISIIQQVVEQYYLKEKKPSVKEIIDLIEIFCNKEIPPVPMPSQPTLYKMVQKINPKLKALYRDGQEVYESKYELVESGSSNEIALYPLHIVQIDHTLLDEDVLDDERKCVIGRPWITLGIDVFSRMPWCLYISFEAPSANVVRKAIIHGVLPKDSKRTNQTDNEWIAWGIPSIIYTDNGSSFNNVQLKRIVDDILLSELRRRPVKVPHYGAVIERYFGTINTELIHRLAGTRKSNIKDLGVYESEKEACLTLSALKDILTIYLTDIYPYEQHKGLPLDTPTPILRYLEGLEKAGFPRFIAPGDENKFLLDLIPEYFLSVTREGIQHDNIRYHTPEIRHLVMGKNQKYRVKIDPDDISYCFIFDDQTHRWIKVLASIPNYTDIAGMNSYTWKKVRKEMLAEGKNKVSSLTKPDAVLKAKSKIISKINQEYTATRSARRQKELVSMTDIPNIDNVKEMYKVDKPEIENWAYNTIKLNSQVKVDFQEDGELFGFREY